MDVHPPEKWDRHRLCKPWPYGCGSKLNSRGYAGFGPWFNSNEFRILPASTSDQILHLFTHFIGAMHVEKRISKVPAFSLFLLLLLRLLLLLLLLLLLFLFFFSFSSSFPFSSASASSSSASSFPFSSASASSSSASSSSSSSVPFSSASAA